MSIEELQMEVAKRDEEARLIGISDEDFEVFYFEKKLAEANEKIKRLVASIKLTEMPNHIDGWGVKCCSAFEVEELIRKRLTEPEKKVLDKN